MKKDMLFTRLSQVISPVTINELEDSKEIVFPSDWGAEREISLKSQDSSVKKQWNGTCTSFAIIAAIENKLGGKFNLSERSLWDFYGKFSTKQAIEAANSHLILEEEFWPQSQPLLDNRNADKGRFRLAKYKYLGRDYASVIKAIDRGNPCVVALSVPKDLAKGERQVEATSKVSRRAGHSMCVSGYKIENGSAYFSVKNSWGTSYGDGGYQYVAFELYRKPKKRRYAIFWEIEEVFDNGGVKGRAVDDEFSADWDFQ